MLEVMQYIFSSFWIWLGTVILISAPFGAISKIVDFKIKYEKSNKES